MQSLRHNLRGILTMLIIEFLLGMGANLFVTLSRHHPGVNPSNYFSGSAQSVFWALTQGPLVLIFHVILGLLLFLNAIAVLGQTLRLPDLAPRILAGLGLAAIIGAGFNGASFLDFNQDTNSFIMSIGFAFATAVYLQMLYSSSDH